MCNFLSRDYFPALAKIGVHSMVIVTSKPRAQVLPVTPP